MGAELYIFLQSQTVVVLAEALATGSPNIVYIMFTHTDGGGWDALLTH